MTVTEARPEADTEGTGTAGAIREAVSTGTATEEDGTGEDTAEDATAPVLDLDLVAATMAADEATTAVAANGSANAIETPCWEATPMTGIAGRAGTQAVLPAEVGAAIRQTGASSAAEARDVSIGA